MAVFDITHKCNLNCTYCNRVNENISKNEKKDPSLMQIKDVFKDLQAFGIKHLALQGGEPMTRNDIRDIICELGAIKGNETINLKREWSNLIQSKSNRNRFMIQSYLLLKKIKFPILSITSNGTIYSEEIKDALVKNNFHLEVSVDTNNSVLHDKYRRGHKDNFNRIVANIKKYALYVPTIMQSTVYDENVNNIREMVNFAYDLGCIHLLLNPLKSVGKATGIQTNWSLKYVNEVINLMDLAIEKKLPIIVEAVMPINFIPSDEIYHMMLKKQEASVNFILNFHKCSAYNHIDALHITPELDVYGCQQFLFSSNYSIGNMNDNFISSLWDGEKRMSICKLLEQRITKGQCHICEKLSLCKGGCSGVAIAENGILASDLHCNMNKMNTNI